MPHVGCVWASESHIWAMSDLGLPSTGLTRRPPRWGSLWRSRGPRGRPHRCQSAKMWEIRRADPRTAWQSMSGASGAIKPQTGSTGGKSSLHGKGDTYDDKSDTEDVRYRNMVAAKAIADIVRTSLGPRRVARAFWRCI